MMFPKPTGKGGKKASAPTQATPETVNVTCQACDCNFNVPAKAKEPPECPACGETLAPVKRG